jgi:hypothetical protein
VDDFSGRWIVEEVTMPNGRPGYTGAIEIRRNGAVFDLQWDISDGRYVGIGLASGTHLFVSCGEQRAGLGIALLEAQLSGVSVQWCTPGLTEPGTGRFTSGFDGNFEGEQELIQVLPNGLLHGAWTLQVSRSDSVYNVNWSKGGVVHHSGLGFAWPDGLVAGWYPDPNQLALLDYVLDPATPDRLCATWALGGFNSLGTEILHRARWRGPET